MKYMGSKRRIAKEIVPIITAGRKPLQPFIEPFCGGCNLTEHVRGPRRANDNHKELIAMWRALQSGWSPPISVSEEMYRAIKSNPGIHPPHLVGYVGFNSFAAKWWGGYRRDSKGTDYWAQQYRSIMKQLPKLADVDFSCGDYREMPIPQTPCIIYCDPPYESTTGYRGGFDHALFWQWCRDMSANGHSIFVSEYGAPDDFAAIWEKDQFSSLDLNTAGKSATERLFVPRDTTGRPQPD